MALIYLFFLIIFPLIPAINKPGPMLDVEFMLRGRRWLAVPYLLGMGILFFAYWRAVKLAHTLSRENPEAAKALRGWVLGAGIVCGIILVGLYPINALDVALYVVHARRWVLFGGNPMLTVPADFPADPYLRLAGEFSKEYTPYGPLWEWIARIPVQLGLTDIGGGILGMKIIALIAFTGMALLIGWNARQDSDKNGVSSLTALAFFALNPLVLMEGLGNGHNDMVMLVFITLGLVLWQRGRWAWATLALTGASLVKATGLILIPLFGMAVLVAAPDWPARIKRAAGMAFIFLLVSIAAYRIMGPFPEVFAGTKFVLFNRTGYAPASFVRFILRFFQPDNSLDAVPRTVARDIFILCYAWLLLRLAMKRLSLLEAGFLAFFSQIYLGPTFRIWYPLWVVPFAALSLASGTWWRTFLFSITSELSILSYYLIWRWGLKYWDYGLNGPLKQFYNYWGVMTLINVPWVFGIPLLGPWLLKRKNPERFRETLWL
jgi:hypothetical protein